MEEQRIPTAIEAMRRQEENFYAVRGDYMYQRGESDTKIDVDYRNRESMVEWSYKVIDFLGFQKETVEIAMNYFDRFLLTPNGSEALSDCKKFQLANMACLYLSIKIHEDVVLDSKFMANLSNNLFTYYQVEAMELHILGSLGWWVNPPSSFAFLREYLQLLPATVTNEMKEKAFAICDPQLQASVIDYNFVNARASTVALFALMNALKVLGMDAVLLSHIGSLLSYASRMDHHFESSVYKDLKQSLYESLILDIPGLPDAGETEITSTGITCGASMSLSAQRARATDRTATKSPCGVFS